MFEQVFCFWLSEKNIFLVLVMSPLQEPGLFFFSIIVKHSSKSVIIQL